MFVQPIQLYSIFLLLTEGSVNAFLLIVEPIPITPFSKNPGIKIVWNLKNYGFFEFFALL